MLYGSARITAIDVEGGNFIDDVGVGDLWYFPSGVPHSIQGLGPDGCEFLLVFDDGDFDEDNTFLISDWFKHTPNDILAKNFGVPASLFGRYHPPGSGRAGFAPRRRLDHLVSTELGSTKARHQPAIGATKFSNKVSP
jgi:Cupin